MAIISKNNNTDITIENIGRKMMLAAQTAPKGKGQNTLEIKLLTGDHIIELSNILKQMEKKPILISIFVMLKTYYKVMLCLY